MDVQLCRCSWLEGSVLSPSPVILLLPAYVCALASPSQQNPPFWHMRVGDSPLPYVCKSVGSAEKGRHRALQLCKWCYGAWCCGQGLCVPRMTSLLKEGPRNWSFLGQQWLGMYPEHCWGTWRSCTWSLFCFTGPNNSFLLPKPRGCHQGTASTMQALSALQQ